MKIAYITILDPKNYQSWSGLNLNIYNCLRKNHDVDCIGPLNRLPKIFFVVKRYFYNFFKIKFDADRVVFLSKYYSYIVSKKLKKKNYDLIVTTDTTSVAYLITKTPIVIWTDVTFYSYYNSYFKSQKIHSQTIKDGNKIDLQALTNAAQIFLTSKWAKLEAIRKYKIPQNKIKVLPFGSNIEFSPNKVKIIANKKQKNICNIISIGVDWERKGIDKVILICKLIKKELNVGLTIIGAQNKIVANFPEWINIVPFVDKNIRSNHRFLSKLLLNSHFHLLFPKHEACGVVFAEASSHGLINITHDIDGIPGMVKNNFNGYRFKKKISKREIAKFIIKTYKNKKKYISLVKKSKNYFDSHLNWSSIGKKFFNKLSL